MKHSRTLLLAFLALFALAAHAAPWTEGEDYAVITPAQGTSVPAGKVEVLEVFSYGCPACNAFQPTLQLLKKSLPANAQLAYLPAAFNTAEDWPMFQRAYLTAQALGIAERTHQQMYDAVWKSGELQTVIPGSNRLKSPQPTIEDAAKLYARWTGVKESDFLAMARSFGVDTKIRAAEAQIIAMQVPSTPTLVIGGRYRINNEVRHTPEQMVELVRFLIAKAAGSG
jgi:protein dithiol oxidoreductase (disulfide-forming)